MFGGNNGAFGLDIGALLGNMMAGNNGNNGWGGDGWWALIIILALFGWGGEGNGLFGNRGNGSSTAAMEASLQRGFDNQSVINKLDGLSNGLCSLGYDQLSQMNNIGQAIGNARCSIENVIQQSQFANQTGLTALGTQLQQCCCDLRTALMQAEYNRQTDTCAITTAINQAAQTIVQNDNCNYRQLHDEMVDIQRQQDKATIAELRAALSRCDSQNMINAQTQQLEQYLRPQPNPAFIVPAPWGYGWGWNNGGNNGCCNNGGFTGF